MLARLFAPHWPGVSTVLVSLVVSLFCTDVATGLLLRGFGPGISQTEAEILAAVFLAAFFGTPLFLDRFPTMVSNKREVAARPPLLKNLSVAHFRDWLAAHPRKPKRPGI